MATMKSTALGVYPAGFEFLKEEPSYTAGINLSSVPAPFLLAVGNMCGVTCETPMSYFTAQDGSECVRWNEGKAEGVVMRNPDHVICGNKLEEAGNYSILDYSKDPLCAQAIWEVVLHVIRKEKQIVSQTFAIAWENLVEFFDGKSRWDEVAPLLNDEAVKSDFHSDLVKVYAVAWGAGLENSIVLSKRLAGTGRLFQMERLSRDSLFVSLGAPTEDASSESLASENEEDFDLAKKLGLTFTEEEQARIPKKEDWFVMPNEGYEIMDEIINSKDLRNYWLIGKAGTGKTELAKQIAATLGLPYVFVNCGSGFDDAKIRGQFIPNPDAATSADPQMIKYIKSLTNRDFLMDADIVADKIGAKSAETTDIISRIMEICSASGNRPEFLWQDSPIIWAYTRPCVCEIQEADCIRDPGVLTNFNSILECGENKFIQLDNGKVIRKNPYCIYIFTSNMQYEGCRMINNAVFDRLDPYRLRLPDVATRVTRISKRTGFTDKKTLRRMVEIVDKLDNYMTENGLTTGVCGMRSLEHWAEALLIWQRKHPGKDIPDSVLGQTGERKVLAKTAQPEEELNEMNHIWYGYFGQAS